jgi:hypothetical protein
MGEAAAGISGCDRVEGLPDGGHQRVKGACLGGAQLRLEVLERNQISGCDGRTTTYG